LQTYLFNGKIYAIGGSQYDNSAIASVQVYDPVTDTWEGRPNMPKGLVWFAGAFANNKIYVIGGLPSGWTTIEGKVWEYVDPTIPVELTSFTATANGKELLLSWSTATEINNQGFEVQRKFGSNDFVTIGSVKGHGTTTTPNNYSLVDKLVDGGKYIYRLKQIDFSGTFEYSDAVEVEVRVLDKFTLEQNYPNPFNPSTKIKFTIPLLGGDERGGLVLLKIFDVLGNEVATLVNEFKPANNYEVEFKPASSFKHPSSGVFFYQLKVGSYIETKKMILLR
jgi:hypothetical protein